MGAPYIRVDEFGDIERELVEPHALGTSICMQTFDRAPEGKDTIDTHDLVCGGQVLSSPKTLATSE